MTPASAPNVLTRKATVADLPAIRALLQTYYAEIHVAYVDSDAELRVYLMHPRLGFEVAEEDGALVGCVLTRQIAAFPNGVECKRLYVLPTHRHLHLASKLMDAAEADARAQGAAYIYLDSRRDLTAALALYTERGYVNISRYNDNPEAGVFMRKSLEQTA